LHVLSAPPALILSRDQTLVWACETPDLIHSTPVGSETNSTGFYIDSVLLKVLTNITSASNQIVKDLRSQPSDPRLHRKSPTNYRPRKPFGPCPHF
jgi:hypothetical protein